MLRNIGLGQASQVHESGDMLLAMLDQELETGRLAQGEPPVLSAPRMCPPPKPSIVRVSMSTLFLSATASLMAFGARFAGGCTSGHGISGALQLNVGSWIAVVCFFIGGIKSGQ